MIAGGGAGKGRLVFGVHGVRIGAVLEERFDHRHVAVLGGDVQGRVLARVLCVELGAALDEQQGNVGAAAGPFGLLRLCMKMNGFVFFRNSGTESAPMISSQFALEKATGAATST